MNKTLTLIVLSFFLAVACSYQPPETPAPQEKPATPEPALTGFLKAALAGKDGEAYEYLSSRDRAAVAQNEYTSDFSKDPFLRLFREKVSYAIKEPLLDGDRAVYNVEISAPDTMAVFENVYAFIKGSNPKSDEDRKQIREHVSALLTRNDVPIVTGLHTFHLFKEPDGWKLFFDLEREQEILSLYAEAASLEKERKLSEAREKYREIVSLDSEEGKAVEKTARLDRALDKSRIREDRTGKIKVWNIRVTEAERGGLGIFGEIRNLNRQTLTRLGIKISYLDKNSRTIFSETRYPIDIKSPELKNRRPLKSRATKNFGYSVDKPPKGWNKKVRVEVIGFEFAEKERR